MLKTDVENILQDRPGVLISVAKPTTNFIQRKRMLEQESRINTLESEMNIIKNMLQQILNKVNK